MNDGPIGEAFAPQELDPLREIHKRAQLRRRRMRMAAYAVIRSPSQWRIDNAPVVRQPSELPRSSRKHRNGGRRRFPLEDVAENTSLMQLPACDPTGANPMSNAACAD
jgi:hypothetical protein